ncbi:hypothetical protein BH11MYX1_BH11MYX1_34760 [soil metagenome]
MALHFTNSIEIAHSAERVFALLADVARTPEWLSRCTAAEIEGPIAAGAKLRLSVLQGKKTGTLVGSITAFEPATRIAFHYGDALFAAMLEFGLSPTTTGTRLVETLDITTHTFAGKLAQPLIRGVLAKVLVTDLEKLRNLV